MLAHYGCNVIGASSRSTHHRCMLHEVCDASHHERSPLGHYTFVNGDPV